MGLWDFLKNMFAGSSEEVFGESLYATTSAKSGSLDIDELAKRLGVSTDELMNVRPIYNSFKIPKQKGGHRSIHAPNAATKRLQQKILKRVLAKLKVHPAATAYEKGKSIADNAQPHVGQHVVLKMDLRDFFPNTTDKRIEQYFRYIGWNKSAAKLLTKLTTYKGGLPQGAPTSPRLSNLVNYKLDARLAGMADIYNPGSYTRYADDITFSFQRMKELPFVNPATGEDLLLAFSPSESAGRERIIVATLIQTTKEIVAEFGYTLHQKDRKLRIARAHQMQTVTGLVVNEKVNLPRKTRRWLRAVEHRMKTTGQATLTEQQLAGWKALQTMILQRQNAEEQKSER